MAIVESDNAGLAVDLLRQTPYGRGAAVIGEDTLFVMIITLFCHTCYIIINQIE
ncbi:hypothetical protein IT084_16175 [Desulfallas sp. Bu1-1]|uniref:hypothetical protein n=1 Tax=Desulfallas sp. Bu1-1 TaxID=2787620 RepID=UPI00189F4E95|nr:hypothetical protein [Desulfallas sp. Bu1-1]MBF7084488.1 hypothetical protein [Desulfallas sp. Bu1-1]